MQAASQSEEQRPISMQAALCAVHSASWCLGSEAMAISMQEDDHVSEGDRLPMSKQNCLSCHVLTISLPVPELQQRVPALRQLTIKLPNDFMSPEEANFESSLHMVYRQLSLDS